METKILKNFFWLKWAVILGLVVVLNLLFNYSIHLVYPALEYEKFCPESPVSKLQTEAECAGAGGAWTETPPPLVVDSYAPTPVPTGYCDPHFTCRRTFSNAEAIYNRNVFVVLVALGLAAIIIGFLTAAAPAVTIGLSLGGVLSLVIGAIRYWSDMQDYLRVIILALALAVLIWLGAKKLRE